MQIVEHGDGWIITKDEDGVLWYFSNPKRWYGANPDMIERHMQHENEVLRLASEISRQREAELNLGD